MDRLNRLSRDYIFNTDGLHAFYIGYDQQSPQDWYQIEIFSKQKEEDLLEDELGFNLDQVTLGWNPQEVVNLPLGMDIVATRGMELLELDFVVNA